MDNVIYGFDNELMISLIDYLKQNKNLTLTTVFKNFALQHDKSWGTIRNLYYAIIKKAGEDEDFKKRYLTGVDISVNKIDKFTNVEEKELIDRVVKAQTLTNELLNKEQRESVENFVGTLHEMHGISLKKAFCKGCEFATSFLLELQGYKK